MGLDTKTDRQSQCDFDFDLKDSLETAAEGSSRVFAEISGNSNCDTASDNNCTVCRSEGTINSRYILDSVKLLVA
jgi:hypothetical protein